MEPAEVVRVGAATRRGVRDENLDAWAVFRSETGAVAGAVADGVGQDPVDAVAMRLAVDVAVRLAPRRSVLAGIVTAADVVRDAGPTGFLPRGVMVLAVVRPGQATAIGWVGDSHVYGWDGQELVRRTTPHTMGEFLRQNGDADLAPRHDNWIRTDLVRATVSTVAVSEIPAGHLVVLVSDGLDSVGHDALTDLVRAYQDDPQALADALVAAATVSGEGYRDDATAVVLCPPRD